MRLAVLGALALLPFASVSAQSGTFRTMPFACSPVGFVPPGSTVSGSPTLGSTMRFTYTGPNAVSGFSLERPIFTLGFQLGGPVFAPAAHAGAAGISLFFEPAQCFVVPSHDFVRPMPQLVRRFEDVQTLAIPSNPSLVGMTFFVQWLTQAQTGRFGTGIVVRLIAGEIGVGTVGV